MTTPPCSASEACAFQSQLRQYGVVKPTKKLPWRHRWPDEVRDDVLARLLALNAERYAEEQAMGLKGLGLKGGGASGTGKQMKKKLKWKPTEKTEQTMLILDSPRDVSPIGDPAKQVMQDFASSIQLTNITNHPACPRNPSSTQALESNARRI